MATITAAAGGGNWNVGSTWVGGVVPLTTDDVVLNATSGQVTITATAQCKDINFSGYTNTITFNANLTITGNLTRNTSVFSYAGTFGIIIAGTTTQIITTSSVAWTIPVTFGGTSPNITINSAFNITAPLTLSSTTTPIIARSNVFDLTENVNLSGNITISGNGTYTGSANIVVSGSNNQTLTASGSHQIRNNLTIDKTGGVLSLSGTLNYNTGTLAYVASGGTVNASTSTLNIGASTTLNTNGINWNNVTTSGTTTLTLSSNFNITNLTINSGCILSFSGTGLSISGNLTMGGAGNGASTFNVPNNLTITNFSTFFQAAANNYTLNGNTISITGNITVNMNNNNGVLGNTTLKMVGTGNLTFSNSSNTNFISNPFTIDTAGTITTVGSGTPLFSSSTITYTLGTITGVGVIFSACTLNLNSGGKWGTDANIRGNTTLTSNATFGNLTTNTTAVVLSGAFNINVEGNLAINIATSGASTPILLNGTGAQTWTHGSAVYLSNSLTINKPSGTLTLGANTYTSGNFTYTQGNIDFTTNNNTFWVNAGTYVTTGLRFNTFVFASSGGNSITLGSDLYANTFTVGGNATINGSFDIYSATLNINNSTSGAGGAVTYARNFYCSGDCNVSVLKSTATAYVGGNCSYANASSAIGFTNLYMIGNGTLTALATGNFTFPSNLYINTSGKIKLVGTFSFGNDTNTAAIINLIRGSVDASKATIILPTAQTHTLTNMNKMLGGNISINTTSPPVTLIMNEFFCGDSTTQTNITTTNSTNNATVTFTDNFEKIAKFVTMNGITFTRPQQLLLLTNQPKKTRNRGIRYNNDLPNGLAKNDPSVQNQMAYSVPKYLIGDPNMIKSI